MPAGVLGYRPSLRAKSSETAVAFFVNLEIMANLLRVVILFLLACRLASAETGARVLIEYKTAGEISLRLHAFYPPDYRPTDSRPAIVFFFGGGWHGGNPLQFYRQSKHLAARGMVCFCAEYRIKSKHDTPPSVCVQDGKSAVRFLRRKAKQLGIDPHRIAAGGGSAGGQIAAAAATVSGLNEPGEDLTVSCRPDALALFNPVFDNGPGGYGHDRVKDYWQEFSPLHNLVKADEQSGNQPPPTIVFLGDKDELIPVTAAENYDKQMKRLKARCDLHIFKDQPHGFFNQAKYDETLRLMDEFLVSLGWLDSESTLKKRAEGA